MKLVSMPRFVIGCLMVAVLISLCSICSAIGTETSISANPACTASGPASSNGWVVWEQNCPSGQSFIIAYNYTTGQELMLPNVSFKAKTPEIEGFRVVWVEGDFGSPTEIYYSDLNVLPLNAYLLPAGKSEKYNPVVNTSRIVWQNKLPGSATYDILMYDTNNRTLYNLTPNTGTSNQQNPSIFGDMVAWEDHRSGNARIHIMNTSTWSKTVVPALPDGSNPTMPFISGNSVVWNSDSSDIFLYDIPRHVITQITNDGPATAQFSPAICATFMVWKDDRFAIPPGTGIFDVAYYDTANPGSLERITDADTAAIIPASTNWRPGITTDDRIIWQDERYGRSAIFMFSRNVNKPCTAAFTAPGFAQKNQPVHFTDSSTGTVTHWSWNFGDGTTSSDQNPVHAFTSPGTFPVTLTVSNPYCRNRTPVFYVSVDDIPVAQFTANITTGMVPLTVQFSNASIGWQKQVEWNFGDGSPHSNAPNPVHTYATGGRYTVTLNATNDIGSDIEQKTGYIHALSGGTMTQSTEIAGITIQTTGGEQHLQFNTTQIPLYTFNPTDNSILSCTPPGGSGFQRITFYSKDGAGFSQAGGIISGTLSRTIFLSSALPLSAFTNPALGTHSSIYYTLDYPGYPVDATLAVSGYDDTAPDYGNFSNTAHGAGFTSISGIPYIVQFRNANLGSGYLATINMSVDSTWMAGHGGDGQVYSIRVGDDLYGEILTVQRLSRDIGNNLDNFGFSSPKGLSKFAVSGLSGSGNVFQLVYLEVAQHLESSPPSDSSGGPGPGAGTGKGTGQGLVSQQNQPLAPAPATPSTPTVPIVKTAVLYINSQAIVTQTTVLQSADKLATIAIGQGVTAIDATGHPLGSIRISAAALSDIPGVPQGSTFRYAGIAYELQPDGAAFSPAITITFSLPQAQWGQHYMIKEYDTAAQEWVDLPTTYQPESGTISASVSHFCLIALFSDTIKTTLTPLPTAVPTPLPTIAGPTPTSPFGVFYGLVRWLADISMKNLYLVLIVLAIVVAFYLNRRRKGRDTLKFK
jgi:beta propeller repeat protein